jgi:hypothetical protein
MKTSGWFKQSERHSKARKYGRAGGVYASERIKKILKKHPEYKSLSYKHIKGKGIYLKYGRAEEEDMKPKKTAFKETAKKVGKWIGKEAKTGYEKTKEFVKKETPKVKAFLKKETEAVKEKVKKEYEEYKKKRREAVGRAVAQATQQKIMDEQTEEEREALIDKIESAQMMEEIRPEPSMSQMFNQLKPEEAQKVAEQTAKALTKAEHKNVEDLADVDVKELSDEELKMITIRLGTGFFGQGNRFENEIKRRIREREKVETDLKIELEKVQLESQKRFGAIKKDLEKQEQGGYIWDTIFK